MKVNGSCQIATQRVVLTRGYIALKYPVTIIFHAVDYNIDNMPDRCSVLFMPVVIGIDHFILGVLEEVNVEVKLVTHNFRTHPSMLFVLEPVSVCVPIVKMSGVSSLTEVQAGWKLNAN